MDQEKLEEYNEEPVWYCPRCYSLKIKYEDTIGSDCCMECGCSDIMQTSIYEWEKLYENRYNHKYVQRSLNAKRNPVYKMSLKELQEKVYKHPLYMKIIATFYNRFPKNLSKEDTVIYFMNKILEDNKIDELRKLLEKYDEV